MARVLTFHELRKILARYGIRELKGRGKGSERLFENEQGRTYPITYRGRKKPVGKGLVRAARRAFGLTEADGISDDEFYGR